MLYLCCRESETALGFEGGFDSLSAGEIYQTLLMPGAQWPLETSTLPTQEPMWSVGVSECALLSLTLPELPLYVLPAASSTVLTQLVDDERHEMNCTNRLPIANAVILIYNGLVDLIIPTFSNRDMPTQAWMQALGFGSLFAGAGIMSLIGKWA